MRRDMAGRGKTRRGGEGEGRKTREGRRAVVRRAEEGRCGEEVRREGVGRKIRRGDKERMEGGMEWLLCPVVMEGRCGGKVWGRHKGRGRCLSTTLHCLSLLVVRFATKLSSCVGSLGETTSMLVSFDSVGCSGGLGAWKAPRDGSDQMGSLSD